MVRLIATFIAVWSAAAGEEMAADMAGNAGTTTTLARVDFPLPEQATFEQDLRLLERVLVAKVESPAPEDYTRDRVRGHEVGHVLSLMRHWPNAKFSSSLAKHFRNSDRFVIECAEALVGQRNWDLLPIVETRKQYERHYTVGCFGGCDSVAKILEEGAPPEAMLERLESFLPAFERKAKWEHAVTLRTAVRQLADPDASVRLQSWVWLADHGIVAPTTPVTECWDKLTDEQRAWIISLKPKFVGPKRLVKLFDELVQESPQDVRARLLVRRAELGGVAARNEARQILRDAMRRGDFPFFPKEEPAHSAFRAICAAPAANDIWMLIELHRCDREDVASSAIDALCEIDHPDAIREVGDVLVNPRPRWRDAFLPWTLKSQAARALRHRGLYVSVMARALRTRDTVDFMLIDAFECMAGREFGWNGFASGGDVDQEAARATADKCVEWFDERAKRMASAQ